MNDRGHWTDWKGRRRPLHWINFNQPYCWIEWSEVETPWEAAQAVRDCLQQDKDVVLSFIGVPVLPYRHALEIAGAIPYASRAKVSIFPRNTEIENTIYLALKQVWREQWK